MGSLHVNSLFTDIFLKETINIWTNLLYNNVNNVDVIKDVDKSESENPLSLSTQESYFMKDDVAMESPSGHTMANVFLSLYELKQLEQCPS